MDAPEVKDEVTQANPLGMSDADFMELNSPSDIAPPTSTEETTPAEKPEEVEPVEEETVDPTKVGNVEEIGDNKDQKPTDNTETKSDPTAPVKSDVPAGTVTDDKQTGKKSEPTQKPEEQTASIDHEAFYQQVMKPFKANGKMIELRTPEEAIALMQQGANYTRKMQDLGQHRKTIMMLENNNLLDADKLAYLIDLDKKNPEAIKKFIKESGIDPLELDLNEPVNYLKGNHEVSDEEANFKSTVNELNSEPTGTETLHTINSTWDQASKEVLWQSPEIMSHIHNQRENGIYDRITNEVNRRKMLGQIAPNVPFLQSYKQIGDELTASNGFADLIKAPEPKKPTAPAAIETKVGGAKPPVKNGDKVSAATTARTTPNQTGKQVNPLSLSDDEFLKQFENRL